MDFCVRVPGSCGELLQGWHRGEPFLVTCPIARYTTVEVSSAFQGREGLGEKAERAFSMILSCLGVQEFPYGLRLRSELPQGKGMASSSADIAAVVAAVSYALHRPLTPRQILALAVQIEPTDATFLPGIVCLNQVNGRILAVYDHLPYLPVSIFDTGGTIATADFYRLNAQKKEERDWSDVLLRLQQGERGLAAAAVQSALWQEKFLPKRCLRPLLEEAKTLGALGITAAHSGTVLGVLWPLSMTKAQILSGVSRLRCFLPQLAYLGTTAMCSGGIEIDVKGKDSKDKDRSEGDEKDGNSSFCAWRQYL